LGLDKSHNTKSVCTDLIWFEKRISRSFEIVETTRIGIDYAEEDVDLPWRFYDKKSKFISVR
jgi:DNA-3-methyladenine glycosylase